MFQQLRFPVLVIALILTSCLVGCGARSQGKATFAVGTAGSTWSREVSYTADVPGNITSKGTTATVTLGPDKLVIEKDRVLLNDKELAKVAADAKKVVVDYSAGVLTITADGNKVHDAKLK